jgi:hypothetical protein
MTLPRFRTNLLPKVLCIVLVVLMVSAQAATVVAQGAVQAVRQRVSGLDRGVGPDDGPLPTSPEGVSLPPNSPGATAGKLDTTYVASTAAVVAVVRPAQILASPLGQVFPVEVATAAGMQYLGVDPANVDEVVGFLDLANPMMPAYGVTIKFSQPFRAISIPAERRAHARLAELNGKKYLKSAHPMLPSFYGPNNKTLVLAPDATMQKIVAEAGQSKSGTLIDRTREVPAGSDLYVAVDMVPILPMIQMGMAQAGPKIPPEAKQYVEALNLVAAAELTVNVAAVGPTSLVVHGSDETAAQQIETMMQEARQKFDAASQGGEQPAFDPIQQAMAQYKERIGRPFQPVRSGTSITCFMLDGQDPTQRQMTNVAVSGALVAMAMPAIQAARNAAAAAHAGGPGAMPPDGAMPAGPEGGPAPDGSTPPGASGLGEPERR